MIRFDQRSFDIQAAERVYKKVILPGKNVHMVDKDGIPLRTPTTAASLSRLHSTYVLSPRGVPTRKTTHAYSGQLAQGKMQNLVNSMETQSHPEFSPYMSMLNYNNNSGLSSAGSSRPPMQVTPKKRAYGSGPPRSVKSMPTKSASSSSQRSRYLTSATTIDQMSQDANFEKSNDSAQGKRLEKEWSALSQCRAMRRSSEILSHRVDRMYFMTGNSLKMGSKYHVEDDELQQLRALSQARASSRNSRSSRRGDVYQPDLSVRGSLKTGHLENGGYMGHMNGVIGTEDGHKVGRHDRQKENKEPKLLVSQKALTPKPSSRKSPLQGWGNGDATEKDELVENEMVRRKSLHDEEKSEVDGDAAGNAEDGGSDVKGVDDTDEAAPEYNGNNNNNNDDGDKTAQVKANEMDNSEKQTADVNNDENVKVTGENAENKDTMQGDTEESPNEVKETEGNARDIVNNENSEESNAEQNKGTVENSEEKQAGESKESVQRSDTDASDKDRIDVKCEENLERTITNDSSLQEKN